MAEVVTPQPGGVADEAAKVLVALEGWLRNAAVTPPADPPADPPAAPSADRASGVVRELFGAGSGHRTDSPCTVCPLCQLISAARAVRPDVVEHLAEAMASVLLAFRALTEPGIAEPQESGPSGHDEDQPVVQHIIVN